MVLLNNVSVLFTPAGYTENATCDKPTIHFPQAAKKKVNKEKRQKH